MHQDRLNGCIRNKNRAVVELHFVSGVMAMQLLSLLLLLLLLLPTDAVVLQASSTTCMLAGSAPGRWPRTP